jgi:hypothetical protein
MEIGNWKIETDYVLSTEAVQVKLRNAIKYKADDDMFSADVRTL